MTIRTILAIATALSLYVLPAQAAKEYQVTGPVVEVTPTHIVVQKGKEKWLISRDATTKLESEPKVGSKVTVYYSMTATDITMKAGAKKK